MPKRQKQSRPLSAQNKGSVRMIGGLWRGRKIPVLDAPGLRPTTDRVRETVFNWLQGELLGATCLDLFAGTGALGFESLSRGASHCDFVDNNPLVCRHLSTQITALEADRMAASHCSTAQAYLSNLSACPDIIWIDPPYQLDLWSELVTQLQQKPPQKWIYIETARTQDEQQLPSEWTLHREMTAGQVWARLFRVGG